MKPGNFVFVLGKDDSIPRKYSGNILPPFDGYDFGIRVLKLLNVSSNDELNNLGDNEDISNLHILSFIMKSVANMDGNEISNIILELFRTTTIWAEEDIKNGRKIELVNKVSFDQWFRDYYQDVMLFAYNLIKENVSPFLPIDWLK